MVEVEVWGRADGLFDDGVARVEMAGMQIVVDGRLEEVAAWDWTQN